MWRVCKEAGRSWPTLSDDDVIDYMVMEAVALKVLREESEEQKRAKQLEERRKAQAELVQSFG